MPWPASCRRRSSNPCVLMFGNGITFAPSTYSIQALDGSVFRGSVDYRSTQKQVISAITQESWKTIVLRDRRPESHSVGALRLRTSAGRCACSQRRGERDGCAEQRAHVGGRPIGADGVDHPSTGRTYAATSASRSSTAATNRGQPVPEIDNSCAVEYPDRPRRNPSFPVSAAVLKSDLVKQLATCKLTESHLPGLQKRAV